MPKLKCHLSASCNCSVIVPVVSAVTWTWSQMKMDNQNHVLYNFKTQRDTYTHAQQNLKPWLVSDLHPVFTTLAPHRWWSLVHSLVVTGFRHKATILIIDAAPTPEKNVLNIKHYKRGAFLCAQSGILVHVVICNAFGTGCSSFPFDRKWGCGRSQVHVQFPLHVTWCWCSCPWSWGCISWSWSFQHSWIWSSFQWGLAYWPLLALDVFLNGRWEVFV